MTEPADRAGPVPLTPEERHGVDTSVDISESTEVLLDQVSGRMWVDILQTIALFAIAVGVLILAL